MFIACSYILIPDLQPMTHVTQDVSICTKIITTVKLVDVLCYSSPKMESGNMPGITNKKILFKDAYTYL